MLPVHLVVNLRERRQLVAQQLQIQQARLESIVEIGCVVSDLVHAVHELRFERRPQIEIVFGQLRKIRRGILASAVIGGMFDDAFAHLEREIEAGKIQIAPLERSTMRSACRL